MMMMNDDDASLNSSKSHQYKYSSDDVCGHSTYLTYHHVFMVTTAIVDIFYLMAVAATTGTRALVSANKDV
jgi:hypothetical protein